MWIHKKVCLFRRTIPRNSFRIYCIFFTLPFVHRFTSCIFVDFFLSCENKSLLKKIIFWSVLTFSAGSILTLTSLSTRSRPALYRVEYFSILTRPSVGQSALGFVSSISHAAYQNKLMFEILFKFRINAESPEIQVLQVLRYC